MVNKNKLLFALRFLVSFGLLSALLWIMRNDIGNILDILKNSDKKFFILALCVSIPMTLLLAYRLKILMLGQKIRLPMKDIISLTYLGYFFNNFLPTAVGGDLAKAYYASKKTDNKLGSYAAVLTDRLCGVIAILFIALIGIVFMGGKLKEDRIAWAVAGMSFALILLAAVLLSKKDLAGNMEAARPGILGSILAKISKLRDAINLYRHSPRILTRAVLISLISQSGAILSVYFFILFLGGDIHLVKLFLIIPLVWSISMLPSLNGLGVREGAFVYFLKADIGTDMAFTVSLLWLSVIILYSIIGGVVNLFYHMNIKNTGEVDNDR